MKRKRGHKKGKSKKLALAAATVNSPIQEEETSANSEENSASEGENDDKPEAEAEPEAEVESKTTKVETPPERVEKVANIRPDGVIERPPTTAVYGRVKVKLKTSKPIPLDPQPQLPSSSEPPPPAAAAAARSDADRSSQQVRVDKQVSGDKQQGGQVPEKAEDSVNSMPESKKSGGIKIVSTKVLSPPGGKESSPGGVSMEEKKVEEEAKALEQKSRYDKKELEASLEVIKKVMKMDAAEPFNVPVNPIELGIPDYFDIIDTPMDFGTIRSNLESGTKYMDSEDVYKDVQYIWNNCYKYNNKSDYIVDLMKRVKKNFMKYWVAAGLYTEQTRKPIGGESTPMDDATSGHGKKLKRGKGVKRHRDDCMCAICIMKRRRREREAREAQEAREAGGQATSTPTKVTKTGLPQEYKQEENSHVESPFGDDTSSYMETSPDIDADAEMEDGEEMRLEGVVPQYDAQQKLQDNRMELCDESDRSEDVSEKSQRSDKVETGSYSHVETKVQDESASGIKSYAPQQPSVQPEGQLAGHPQQRNEVLEMEKKRQKLRLVETFHDLENPMLSGLCGTLFPSNPGSVWNGANSLVRRQKLRHHRSGIREAIASFMTPFCKSSSSLK